MAPLTPAVLSLLNANNQILGLPALPGALAPKPPPMVGPGRFAAPPAVKGPTVQSKPWMVAVLKGIGAPLTAENLRFLDAWQKAEGGNTSEGKFNWLNTTRPAPGAVGFNSVGVKNYPDWQTGIHATVGALTNGYYDNIVAALKSGHATAHQLAAMVATSKWGTGAGVQRVLAQQGVSVTAETGGKVAPLAAPIIKLAAQYLGDPYHWGGASPATGFDCSGFVQWLYGQKGISLPRTTFEQWKVGAAVKGPLKPGDIVFFIPTGAGPDHEGLYIGNGQFIQSPHTGDVIKISKLSDYRNIYMGARRIL